MAQHFSITDLFTIGIGPSSSHTVGPMRAARDFAERALERPDVGQVVCELYGSLALTGHGHATDTAILLGLAGHSPEGVCADAIAGLVADIRHADRLMLAGRVDIAFVETRHLLFRKGEFLPGHANAMRFTATYGDGSDYSETYFSVGGGA
ncbi:MAG TPA: serine dehydratase beta chain, partial [Sphingorhabdus lacus]|nr:serine dehydratase beta chain [Sphingorhabdus lacus]